MKTGTRKNCCAFRFFAGWCALLLYVGAFSPLGLGLAALFGSMDRDHRLAVQAGTDGTRVVLHHEQHGAAHHHGVVARALTLFAEPMRAGQPDHVLQFSVPDSFSHPRQLIAPSPAQLDQPALAVTAIPVWPAPADFLSSVSTHPPPAAAGQLLCLRSTVLLI